MELHRRASLVGVAWLAAQLAVPALRVDLARRPPFSPRFSWSMFAGRPIARCSHALTWSTPTGEPRVMPMPPATSPVYRVLAARTPDEFARVVPLLTAYAESDDVVIDALHDLLQRHKRRVDPHGAFVLTSALDCRAYDGHTFRRALRLAGP